MANQPIREQTILPNRPIRVETILSIRRLAPLGQDKEEEEEEIERADLASKV